MYEGSHDKWEYLSAYQRYKIQSTNLSFSYYANILALCRKRNEDKEPEKMEPEKWYVFSLLCCKISKMNSLRIFGKSITLKLKFRSLN
jgi:hypothetical protein